MILFHHIRFIMNIFCTAMSDEPVILHTYQMSRAMGRSVIGVHWHAMSSPLPPSTLCVAEGRVLYYIRADWSSITSGLTID